MNIWMDRIEQRVTVKYFFLKGHESKLIHKELVNTLQDNAIPVSIVKNWIRGFESGELSCREDELPGRPLISLGSVLRGFLNKFPFASARVMIEHFSMDQATMKNILDRELILRKFTPRWVPISYRSNKN
jgi:hypothetical protein